MSPTTTRRPLAREAVENSLREAILDGSMSPGSLVTESEVAEALGYSRGPVREALRTLEAEGFVTVQHGKGVRIAGIDLAAVRDEYELRLIVEPAAAALACRRAEADALSELEATTRDLRACVESEEFVQAARLNDAFHTAIVRLAGNSRLDRLLPDLWNALRLTLLLSRKKASLATFNRALEDQHAELIDALLHRDAERARTVAATHIRDSFAHQSRLLAMADDELRPLMSSSQAPQGAGELRTILDHRLAVDLTSTIATEEGHLEELGQDRTRRTSEREAATPPASSAEGEPEE